MVVASMDHEFDYTTLHRVLKAMDNNTLFIATNANRTCNVLCLYPERLADVYQHIA